MKRDLLGSAAYWDKWATYEEKNILKKKQIAANPDGDSNHRPQYIFSIAGDYVEQILRCYSRGDAVTLLPINFDDVLTLWEKSELLGTDVWTPEQKYTRKTWKINLDFYHFCFWTTGIALCLNVTDKQWERLVNLMATRGQMFCWIRSLPAVNPEEKLENPMLPKSLQETIRRDSSQPRATPKKNLQIISKAGMPG